MQLALISNDENPYTNSILKSYLQLILAISSKEKSKILSLKKANILPDEAIINFQNILEAHFIQERSASFYADKFNLSTPAFSKKIKLHFGKSPTQLIKERVVLEAKKLLHLTYLQINEIARNLNFEDEFYFSRYFKNEVGFSPAKYRKDVGISIVAKKSM